MNFTDMESFLLENLHIYTYVCNSKSPVARDFWFLDNKSMATGLLLLYVPPGWSLRHTWPVHIIRSL